MKKITMGIVSIMMVFGTMTMNGNTVTKSDKNNHNNNVVKVDNKDMGGHDMNGTYNMGGDKGKMSDKKMNKKKDCKCHKKDCKCHKKDCKCKDCKMIHKTNNHKH